VIAAIDQLQVCKDANCGKDASSIRTNLFHQFGEAKTVDLTIFKLFNDASCCGRAQQNATTFASTSSRTGEKLAILHTENQSFNFTGNGPSTAS
jgi:hypothetical protein